MLQFFAYSWSPSLVICGETSNTTTALHLQQFFFPFLAIDCKCARSSIIANASTMLNDIILCTVMSKMCCSMTLQFISNVEVGEKIFDGATMIFSLHAQWWGAILAIFLRHHIFLPLLGFLMYPGGDALSNHPKQYKLSVNWKKMDLNCKKNTLPQDYKVCENVMKFPQPSPLSPQSQKFDEFFLRKQGIFDKDFFFFWGLNFTSFQRFTNFQKPAKFILP